MTSEESRKPIESVRGKGLKECESTRNIEHRKRMSGLRTLRPLRTLFLGAPGSGKGTQTNRLLKDFPHIASLSSGDTLRKHVKENTPIGKKVGSILEKGGFVPDETMVSLIREELEANKWLNPQASWVLDGFPRTGAQAPPLDETLKRHDAMLNIVVELNVPEDVILDRIEKRWVVSENKLFVA